jgi:hypothetical protein
VSGFWSIRRLTTGAILFTAAAGAVTLFGQSTPAGTSSAPAVSTTGPTLPPPTAIPSLDDPIAVINGRPVNNRIYYSIMMQVAGMRVFQQVLDLTLVQDACQNAGILMAGKDFEDRLKVEAEKYMDQVGIPAGTFEKRTADLGVVLQQRNASAVEFRIGLETSALLRAMSERNVSASDDEAKTRYEADYGERRKVHIVSYDPAKTPTLRIQDALKTKSAEDVCKDLSLNPPAVWDIPSNAKDDKVVEKIRDVAWMLKTPKAISAETDVTGANGQKQTVLVMLDEITADRRSQPGNSQAAKLDECRKKVLDLKQGQWMNNHLALLRSKAAVEIKDPTLAEMYKQVARAIQDAASRAASQPGGDVVTSAPSSAPTSAPMSFPAATTRSATGAATGRGRP